MRQDTQDRYDQYAAKMEAAERIAREAHHEFVAWLNAHGYTIDRHLQVPHVAGKIRPVNNE